MIFGLADEQQFVGEASLCGCVAVWLCIHVLAFPARPFEAGFGVLAAGGGRSTARMAAFPGFPEPYGSRPQGPWPDAPRLRGRLELLRYALGKARAGRGAY